MSQTFFLLEERSAANLVWLHLYVFVLVCYLKHELLMPNCDSSFLLQTKPCSRTHPDGETSPEAPQTNRDFSDPVYKEIALANGHINRMSKDELRVKLAELKLDTR